MGPARGDDRCDVLVVGAGPTGLTLAAQLHAFGASVRVVDAATDRAHESRALAVQPRTLEILRGLEGGGVAHELVARGNPTVDLCIRAGGRVTRARLFDIGIDDTAFPFLLFVSQAQTEAVLGEHVQAHGVSVQRGCRLVCFEESEDGLSCTLRARDGGTEVVRSSYLAGCDGANSTIRAGAGIPFLGGDYPQTFLLADLDADGLAPGAVNAFVTEQGPLFFFPLGSPAPWRGIAMRSHRGAAEPDPVAELQAQCDAVSGGRIQLHDPVWATPFRLRHRHAAHYRAGRVFLAGDAAHVHSPAGAQGMNTGIQDAWNLGWKLALVCRGVAPEHLLDSYDAERRPVGQFVLRFTDRAFTVATSANPLLRRLRTRVAPGLIPWALRFRRGRALAFRTVSQLGIRYRGSPAVQPAPRRLGRAPRAGDRLPDAPVVDASSGQRCWLQQALPLAGFFLLLCGPEGAWDAGAVTELSTRYGELLRVRRLDRRPSTTGLYDVDGLALRRLRVRGNAVLVVRPDGHIGHRGEGRDLDGAGRYLARWVVGPDTVEP